MESLGRVLVSVVVIEERAVHRQGLARAIAAHPDLQLLGESGDFSLGLQLTAIHRPRLVVINPASDEGLGDETVRQLVSLECQPVVLGCLDVLEPGEIDRLRKLGVSAVMSTDEDPEESCRRMLEVAASAGGGLTLAGPPVRLTPREQEILCLVAEGMLVPDIARRLYLSASTIKTHMKAIYEKFGVHDRAAAVACAFRVGLLS